MSTAMSSRRAFIASTPHESTGHAKWLIALAAGCGLTALGIGADNVVISGLGAALLGSGLLYANTQLWLRVFGSKQ